MPATVEIFGVRIDPVSWRELREHVVSAASRAEKMTVMYANVHVLNLAYETPRLGDALRAADLVYCDGEGARLAARLGGARLPARMTGADFIWDMASRLADASIPIYWLGGAPAVAASAMERLRARTPGLTIVGTHHGFFAKSGPENDEVIAEINASRPGVLFVGMGSPAQELWVAEHRDRLQVPVVWCIGATADFIAGVQPRGPDVLTQHGFEWLARLVSDPRRLFGRYVIGNPVFFARVLRARVTGYNRR